MVVVDSTKLHRTCNKGNHIQYKKIFVVTNNNVKYVNYNYASLSQISILAQSAKGMPYTRNKTELKYYNYVKRTWTIIFISSSKNINFYTTKDVHNSMYPKAISNFINLYVTIGSHATRRSWFMTSLWTRAQIIYDLRCLFAIAYELERCRRI